MTRAPLGLAAFLAALLALTGTAQAQNGKLSDDALTVAKGNNVFAFNLYAQLSKEKGNLFFSPYSISSALAMTYGGARKTTAEQMATTLHFALPQDRLHGAFAELVRHMNAKGENRPYKLSVANALWGQKGYAFQPEFLNLTRDKYDAGLLDVDFVRATEEARQTINKWVEKETQDKIKDLLQPNDLKPNTRLVLTNAIYFKGDWFAKFEKKHTKDEDFTLADGEKIKVPLMHKKEKVPYLDGGTFQAVKIPYKGDALSMVILLPKKAGGLAELEKRLTATDLAKWLGGMHTRLVDLKLPKFKMTTRFSLKKTLPVMGMPIAFNPGADFSGISTQDKLFIQDVIHKAFVDVNEEGTEAAAATAVLIGKKSKPAPPPAFHTDRPFSFLIYDNRSGSILFMGRVNNPRG